MEIDRILAYILVKAFLAESNLELPASRECYYKHRDLVHSLHAYAHSMALASDYRIIRGY
jgi:hypothetical protein